MPNSIFRLLLSAAILCAFFSLMTANAAAQCAGVYFKPSTSKIFSEKISEFVFAEMNGDGKVDLVGYSPDEYYWTKRVYIYPNDGSGNFGTPKLLTFPAQPTNRFTPFINDYNSDGKNDLVILLNTNPVSIFIYLNDGNANFTAQTPVIFPNNETIINIVDINGDGRKDFISNAPSSIIRYRLTNSDGTLGNPVQLNNSAYYTLAADFNGDGKIDFPVVNGNSLNFYYNLGNGVFSLGSNPIDLGSSNTMLQGVNDFNNDGKPDLYFIGLINGTSTVQVLTNTGNGNFSVYSTAIQFNYNYIKTGDFNGDGLLDIYAKGTGSYLILTSTGGASGGFSARTYNSEIRGDIGYLGGFDLDGDGKADAVSFSRYNENAADPKKVFAGESQFRINKNVCNRFGQTKIIDFDGDGLNDFAFWNQNTGRWRYQRRTENFLNGSYEATGSVTFQWGQAGDVPTPGDYDGDGKTDYAVYRPSTGVWYIYQSAGARPYGIAFGTAEDKPVPADYNGDGRTDIAVFRPSKGGWFILYSGGTESSGVLFGQAEDKPVPEDYDGDGKTDIAVFRPSTNSWYILQSSNNSFLGVQWGLNSDLLVPADYDGDGKADVAVMRPGATNYTYILRSNGMGYASYAYGTNGDIPQISDWDDNGIADIGVYRPTNKVWYLLPVTINYSVRNAGVESGEQLISSTMKSY